MYEYIIPLLLVALCSSVFAAAPTTQPYADYVLDYNTLVDPAFQASLEKIDANLRDKFHITDVELNYIEHF